MKASFFKRLFAYMVDTIFLSVIINLIAFALPLEGYNKANEEFNDLASQFAAQEITKEEYLESSIEYIYKIQDSGVVLNSMFLVLTIGYFIVFQYLNKGQTLGKKLLKIKVIENGKEPSIKAMILRTFITNSIFSGFFCILLLFILDKNNYYYGYYAIAMIEMVFVFLTALFILYRKDKLGLNDLIAKTEVIEERG